MKRILTPEEQARIDAHSEQPAPKDDLWRAGDYDDEPRSNGNFGIDPSLGWKKP
jgi:hypothetical protein